MKSEKKSWGILGQTLAALTLTAALAGCGGSSDAGSTDSTASVSGAGTAAVTPIVSGTPAATVAANNRYSFQPTVANPSGTPLSFGIQNKPTWATFGETTGQLSGTPAATDAGKYSNIVITANDGTTTTGLPAFSIQVTPAGSSPASSSSSSSGAASSSSSSGAASVASAAPGLTCGGIVWTVVNGVVAKGGVADTSTSQVTTLVCVNNVAYQLSTVPTFGGWYGWMGGKWVLQAGDPRIAAASSSSSSSSSSGGTATVASTSASPTSSPAALLAYLTGLSSQTRHILVGQHTNYWDSNPMDSVTPIPGDASGQQVAILGTSNDWTGTGVEGLNPNASSGFVTLSNAWLAQGGIVEVSESPNSPIASGETYADVHTPGTKSYANWHSYLDSQIAKFKQVNGAVLWRPFNEINGSWSWWPGETAADFVIVWQQTHDYVVSQGVTNVLWLWNINAWDSSGGGSWYPGNSYVDVVSIDAYPPSTAAVNPVYNFELSTGKPIIFAEVGGDSNNSAADIQPGQFNNSTIINTIKASFPKAVAVVFWCQNEGLNQQQGTGTVLSDPAVITLANLPH
jgi:hypothetical protein